RDGGRRASRPRGVRPRRRVQSGWNAARLRVRRPHGAHLGFAVNPGQGLGESENANPSRQSDPTAMNSEPGRAQAWGSPNEAGSSRTGIFRTWLCTSTRSTELTIETGSDSPIDVIGRSPK